MKEVTPEVAAALQAEQVDVVYLVELHFGSETAYYNSTEANVVYDGKTWVGAARIASISNLEESEELQATGFQGVLNAGEAAALALGERFRNRPGKVWLAVRDGDGVIIPDPILLAGARMDKMPIKLGVNGQVGLSCVNRIADWQRENAARYTDAEQRSRYPNDRGFSRVNQTNEREVPWGPSG